MVASQRYSPSGYKMWEDITIIIQDANSEGAYDYVSPIEFGCYLALFGQLCANIKIVGAGLLDDVGLENLWRSIENRVPIRNSDLDEFTQRLYDVWLRLPNLHNKYTISQLAELSISDSKSSLYGINNTFAISSISRNSPTEFKVRGAIWVLLSATIISGGQVKLPGIELKLPPIGQGIQELRQALSRDRRSDPKINESVRRNIQIGLERK